MHSTWLGILAADAGANCQFLPSERRKTIMTIMQINDPWPKLVRAEWKTSHPVDRMHANLNEMSQITGVSASVPQLAAE